MTVFYYVLCVISALLFIAAMLGVAVVTLLGHPLGWYF